MVLFLPLLRVCSFGRMNSWYVIGGRDIPDGLAQRREVAVDVPVCSSDSGHFVCEHLPRSRRRGPKRLLILSLEFISDSIFGDLDDLTIVLTITELVPAQGDIAFFQCGDDGTFRRTTLGKVE